MTVVRVSTDQAPFLEDVLRQRREQGLDTYDEWWEGVYRIVTGPSPEHGELVMALGELFGPLVRAAGLKLAAPVNIGIDKVDCRVPDLGVYRPDTPRTPPAFLESALLVVEVLSPGEPSGGKLDFYATHGVQEYLEIDLASARALLLLPNEGGWVWRPSTRSELLGFTVTERYVTSKDQTVDLTNFAPQEAAWP